MRAIGGLLLLVATAAVAEPDASAPVDLRARHLPFLPRLAMRGASPSAALSAASAAAISAVATAPTTTTTAASSEVASSAVSAAPTTAPSGIASPAEPLRFQPSRRRPPPLEPRPQLGRVRGQVTLGMAVDGAEPSRAGLTAAGNSLRGEPLDDHLDDIGYSRARTFGFGDITIGADHLGIAGISSYIAAQLRAAPSDPRFTPVANPWDEIDPFRLRAAWTEADGIFERGALRSLVLRGGRQYIYGPSIVHFDGLWSSLRAGGIELQGYFGARVPDWYRASSDVPAAEAQRDFVIGGELVVDLRRYHLPLHTRVRALGFERHGHSDLTIDWSARHDLTATGTVGLFDGEIVRERVTVRYRMSSDTRLVLDGDVRQRRDPIWDFAFVRSDDEQAARRYLDLGPSTPRVAGRARAGTVFLDNIDVLLHGGFALDARGDDDDEPSYQAASWLETGAAFEVRVRRAVALGVSGLFRTYRRDDPAAPTEDREDVVQPLELQPLHLGERNLLEGGVSLRFSGGTRRLAGAAEVYARRTRYAERYRDDAVPGAGPPGGSDNEANHVLDAIDRRGGGRFWFEAWITPRLRLRVEYDLSSELDLAPEIRGLKSLRLVADGTF